MGNIFTMKAHLFLSISEMLEVKVEIRGKSLPTGLFFIPIPHASVPGVPVIIIYESTDMYSPDSVFIVGCGKRWGGGLLFFG